MFSLTYVSSANRRYSAAELQILADTSSRNNAQKEITGVLLYKGGDFMQLLEGAEEPVRKLYSIIGCDTRHRGLITLLQGSVEQRHFPDWGMRIEIIPDGSSVVGAPSKFYRSILSGPSPEAKPNAARTLLRKFAQPR
jgi:hypothetical protein